jgi:acetyl esterase/lipase
VAEGPLTVLTGPDVNVDRDGLDRWCAEWGRQLGVEIRCRFAADAAQLEAELTAAAAGRGLVLNPGSVDVGRGAGGPELEVVWVGLDEAERPRPSYLDDPTAVAVRGRGVWGYRWAIQWLLQRLRHPFSQIRYGTERDQFGDLRTPDGEGPWPVAIFLHGGFWRERWERDTIEPLAIDLAGRGFATWNLEYRRVGPYGGGWPATCLDVAAGIDKLADIAVELPLDLSRTVVVGHSAGGHLALWSARRLGIEASTPRVNPSLLVVLAGVADLAEAARRGLGDTGNGTADLVGGSPEAVPERYASASPIEALPLGVPQLVVQGRLDNIPDLVDLSRLYVDSARRAGDEVEFVELDDADHFHLIDPGSAAWPPVRERIEQALLR